MRRKLVAAISAAFLMFILAGAALGAISISPSTQTHNHGVASNWIGHYGNGMREIKFCYGDAAPCVETFNPSGNQKSYSRTFFPCFTTTFTQSFSGHDDFLTYLPVHSTAKELGGTPC